MLAERVSEGVENSVDKHKVSTRVGVACCVGLIAVISFLLDVRPFAPEPRMIGNGDEADVALAARNLMEGKGAVVDVIWILREGGPGGNTPCRPEGYWSIYLAGVLAVFFRVLGAHRATILAAASLIKIAIALLAMGWVWRISRDRLAAAGCAIFLLVDPVMTATVSGLSDIYLTLCILMSMGAAVHWRKQGHIGWACTAGLFGGLAIGFKPSGMLMIVAIPLCMLIFRGRRAVVHAGMAILAMALAATPLAFHNYRAAGTIFWPDLPYVCAAGVVLAEERSWEEAMYDPRTARVEVPFLGRKWFEHHGGYLLDNATNFAKGEGFPIYLLGFSLLGMFAQLRDVRRTRRFTTDAHSLAAGTAVLVCGAAALAMMIFFQARYFNFLVPLCAVLGFVALARLPRNCLRVIIALALARGAAGYWENREWATDPGNVPQYLEAARMLPAGAVVMNNDPWKFAFHTRHPSVMVPYCDDDAEIQKVAARYGARYLVMANDDVRHLGLRERLTNHLPPYLEEVHKSPDLLIARFRQ